MLFDGEELEKSQVDALAGQIKEWSGLGLFGGIAAFEPAPE